MIRDCRFQIEDVAVSRSFLPWMDLGLRATRHEVAVARRGPAGCCASHAGGNSAAGPLFLQNHRHGPVVYELDVHHCAEHAGLDDRDMLPQLPYEVLIKLVAHLRRCGVGIAGAAALSAIAKQRELRHDEGASAHIFQRQVHFAIAIGEYAKLRAFCRQEVGLRGGVVDVYSEQDEYPLTYPADDGIIDGNVGALDALQDRFHEGLHQKAETHADAGAVYLLRVVFALTVIFLVTGVAELEFEPGENADGFAQIV
jgi:hypothetical protein